MERLKVKELNGRRSFQTRAATRAAAAAAGARGVRTV